jgi:alkylation response protein AidB-like acyl-CoA dehydrogenase
MTDRNPFFSDEHQQFQDGIRRFVAREAPKEKVREWDAERSFPYSFFDMMADLECLKAGIPEEYGGTGVDVMYMVILCEEISRWSDNLGAAYGLSYIGAANICHWGSDEQRKLLIPEYLAGKRRFSFSMTEPDTGSDSFALTTFAKDEGDHYVINGEKMFASAAQAKDNMIVLAARTRRSENKRDGISLFLIPNDLPGLEIQPLGVVSRKIIGTNRLVFTDARVPKSALLGPVDKGVSMLRKHLEIERILIAASYAGAAQGALDIALKYSNDRVQFGRPIGGFQAIAHMLADMHTEVEAARLLVYKAAWLHSHKMDSFKEASVAKLHASETSFKVASLGMQILGGYAQLPEFDMERYFRDAKQSMVGGGTNQIQRTIIARSLGVPIEIA